MLVKAKEGTYVAEMSALATIVAPFIGGNVSLPAFAEGKHTFRFAHAEDFLAVFIFNVLVHPP